MPVVIAALAEHVPVRLLEYDDEHLIIDSPLGIGTGAQADDRAFWRSLDYYAAPPRK